MQGNEKYHEGNNVEDEKFDWDDMIETLVDFPTDFVFCDLNLLLIYSLFIMIYHGLHLKKLSHFRKMTKLKFCEKMKGG